MSLFRLLFLLFLLVPVVEIYLLITVGSVIGAWSTVLLVIATAIIGAFLVRQQGIHTLFRFQAELQLAEYRDDPAHNAAAVTAVLEGVLIILAGLLLLTPGLLTDAVGFICLVPSWRRRIISRLPLPDRGTPFEGTEPPRHSQGIIEGNFRRQDRDPPPGEDHP